MIIWLVMTVVGVFGLIATVRGLLRPSPSTETNSGWWMLALVASMALTAFGIFQLFNA